MNAGKKPKKSKMKKMKQVLDLKMGKKKGLMLRK